ncbi:MAG: Holliday junction resolvase RuvX [Firmicutes bacterium]|nr:Holliday junction resolvase RuvX [Bacillota bacterium]
MGLDLGTATLGMAVSDSLGLAAHGVETFRFEPGNYKKARERVMEFLAKENINEIALGLPLHMSGDVSERSQSAIRFKDDLLAIMPNLKITMIDERMTTMLANKRLLEADKPISAAPNGRLSLIK